MVIKQKGAVAPFFIALVAMKFVVKCIAWEK
jgi:hypothetical protein